MKKEEAHFRTRIRKRSQEEHFKYYCFVIIEIGSYIDYALRTSQMQPDRRKGQIFP